MFLSTDTSQQAHYAQVPTISHSRNSFSVEKVHKTTIQFDGLFPLFWKYMYPGDTLSIQQHIMARLATQVGTLYDDLYIDAHAWFVPFRLIQANWARYQFNAQPLGPSQDNSSLTSPSIDLSALSAGFGAKTMYDYCQFGDPSVPLDAYSGHVNNYIARAINLTWNENYRDQNLQNPVVVDLDDGPDDPDDYKTILKRGKRHDKFTSCLTAQQKGAAVTLPLGTSAPVVSSGDRLFKLAFGTTSATSRQITGTDQGGTGVLTLPTTSSLPQNMEWLGPNGTAVNGIEVNLSAAVAASVNSLRTSIAVQHLLEADARGGTRDVEAIQNRWGVTVPDFRLQRPEYLGGATFTFDGHVVPQTSESGTTPQGTLKQFSQSLSSLNINHSFVEHGVFFILVSARSNLTYQYGLARELSYQTRFDWYQPEFANLGEVAVLNKEIFFQGDDGDDEGVFGYQEYGYELRYSDNYVSSEMRSSYATSKDYLHMASEDITLPTLSSAFIESNTPISRNIVVSAATADPIELNTIVKGSCARTLPMFSIPGLTRL
jgi:hypothetical protein